MAKVRLYRDEEDDEIPKSFIPDDDNDNSVPKSFIPDKEEEQFKPAPLALKVDNPSVDKLLAEAKDSLSKTTDWSNPKEEEKVKAEEPKKEKTSKIRQIWDKASEPLTDAPTRFAESVSRYVNPDSETKGVRGIGSAYVEGLGHAVSGLSSPLNLILAGLSGGSSLASRAGLEGIAEALHTGSRVLSAPIAAEGIKHISEAEDLPSFLSGALEAGTGALGTFSKFHSRVPSEELSVRRPIRNIEEGIHPSELPPDLVPVGSEDLFNSVRPEQGIPFPEEAIYNTVKNKFGGRQGEETLPKSFIPEEVSPLEDFKPEDVNIQRNDLSQASPESIKTLNEFMDSIPKEEPLDLEKLAREAVHGISSEEVRPTATYIGEQEGVGPLFNIEGGPKNKSTVTLEGLQKEGIEVPEYEKSNKSGAQLREEALAARNQFAESVPEEKKPFVNPFEKPKEEIPQSFVPDEPTVYHGTQNEFENFDITKNKSHGLFPNMTRFTENPEYSQLYSLGETPSGMKRQIENPGKNPNTIAAKIGAKNVLDLTKPISFENLVKLQDSFPELPEGVSNEYIQDVLSRTKNHIPFDAVRYSEHGQVNWAVPEKTSIKTPQGVPLNKVAESSEIPASFVPDDSSIVEMQGGLGGFSPRSKKKVPFEGRYAVALDALFNAMGDISENRVKQDIINKTERARRFASFESVEGEGRKGAAQSLSRLKGEFEKVDGDALKMGRKETDALFTAIKGANITTPEKARGYTALFKILNGETPQRNELRLLDDVFGNSFAERIVEMHGGLGAVGLKLSKTANTMKAMKSSLDLSAPLRQGIGLVHRPEYRSAFKEMFKYYGDKEYYNEAMQAIESDPDFLKARESGLFLSKHQDLTNSEEAFANNYIGNLPGISTAVDASERAYTGFLNNLRFDTYKNLLKNAEAMGHAPFEKKQLRDSKGSFILDEAGNVKTVEIPTKVAENIAKYINVSTGRGGLGKLEKIAPELNTILWSPRLISSRLSILNPKYYKDMDTFTRREAIKSLFAIAASGLAVSGLGKLAGAKVSTDVNSSDFMKARFGNNVLDPYAGFQQPVVAAARMITELNRMATGQKREFNKPSVFGIAGNFMANKLSPMAALAYEIGSAQKFNKDKPGEYVSRFGEKKNITPEIANAFIPMFIQDVTDVFKSDPSFAEQVGLDTASLFGMGVQQYPLPSSEKKSVFRKLSN